MRVGEMMRREVRSVGVEEPAERAWSAMRRYRIRHLVVVRGSAVAGILSDRDLGGERGAFLRQGKTAGDMMVPSAITLEPRSTVRDAANLLRGHAIGCLPVVDGGALVGIVTTADLLELIGRGTERPVAKSKRWTLKNRGPRRKSPLPRKWTRPARAVRTGGG
jgi:acetoin utilization protein AcuB